MHRILIFFLLASTSCLSAQYLISSEAIGNYTKAQLEITYDKTFRSDVTLYKITYETTRIGGGLDTASGLVVIPDEPVVSELPIVAYQHGTTNGPESCPSRLTAGHDTPIIYGGMGYIVSATDYLGLGDHPGFHPYLHAGTQASAGLDMLIATTEFVENITEVPWVGPLFISGYSQGGHAAAALQKELEANWSFVFPVTASTPMSGPYDLSGVMYERVVSDEIYFFPSYIAYVIMGLNEIEGNLYDNLNEIMKDQYAVQSVRFYNREITLFELNTFMINTLITQELAVRPSKMFRDSILTILRNDTLDHPLKQVLRDNDLYDWVPQAPTRLYYCEGDEQVPYQNSLVADSVMNANGAADVKALSMDLNANHAQCAVIAIQASVEFFDSFILTSSIGPEAALLQFDMQPNPVSAGTHLTLSGLDRPSGLEVFASDGRRVLSGLYFNGRDVDISNLNPGIYLVRVQLDDQVGVQKLIIR